MKKIISNLKRQVANAKKYKNGKKEDRLNNLKWGTRKEQAIIHVSNSENFKRVQNMGLKYGHINAVKYELGKKGIVNLLKWKSEHISPLVTKDELNKAKELIKQGLTLKESAKQINRHRSTLYKYKIHLSR